MPIKIKNTDCLIYSVVQFTLADGNGNLFEVRLVVKWSFVGGMSVAVEH